jgi:hypothetical protein
MASTPKIADMQLISSRPLHDGSARLRVVVATSSEGARRRRFALAG